MLKREHLCCTIRSGNIKPAALKTDDPKLLELAAALTAIYSGALAEKLPRCETACLAGNFIDNCHDRKTAAALNKLLLDRCTFAPACEVDYPAMRKEKFLHSACAIKAGNILMTGSDEPDIYGDLPEFERLQDFAYCTPQELLNRCNIAQAQGLLIYADHLEVQMYDPDVSQLRRVMKAVKFFRLLAEFSRKGKKEIHADISGPYALFGPTVRYALSLAALLPVICRLEKWTIKAQVRFKERILQLKLSEKNGFVTDNRSFSSYIPEEIRLYHRSFAQKQSDWVITGETPFIDAGDQQLIFPDLSFCNRESGQILHLELFHRWHRGQLDRRIELLTQHPELPLFIGIDRSLLGKNESAEMFLARFPELSGRVWFFRDFPGVENTVRMLKKVAADPAIVSLDH